MNISRNNKLLLAVCASALAVQVQAGNIHRQVFTGPDFTGITNNTIFSLTNNPSYPNTPDPAYSAEVWTDVFDYPTNITDNYGDLSRGFLMAPQTGNYIFWLASDDDGQLWLSTDSSPTNKQLIASVSGWTGQHEWGKYLSQQSAPVALVKGQTYYLEVLHKDGTGGDNVAVGWQLPDGILQRPMPTYYYEPYSATNTAPTIISGPTDIYADDGRMVAFAVNMQPAAQPFTYQWFKDSAPIAGATLPGYEFRARLADNLKKFKIQVGGVTSFEATLYVNADTAAPAVTNVDTMGYNSFIQLVLNEPVTAQSATNLARYSLSGGIVAQSVTLSQDGMTIGLRTTPFDSSSVYNLTLSGLQDYATVPNVLNTNVQFGAVRGHITRQYFLNISGTAVTALTGNAKYPNAPDAVDYNTLFEGRLNWGDNYGSVLKGWLVPDTTGDYAFAIAGDDNSALYLSTDASPANKRTTAIATVASYSGSRIYSKEANQQSALIRLIAGQKYYIEALQKEGTGDDNLAVAWQLGVSPVPDSTAPIPGQNLIPWYDPAIPLAITNQPVSQTVQESRPVILSLGVVGQPAYTGVQWYRNGQPVFGAGGLTYTIAHAAMADDQSVFYAVVSNLAYTVESAHVTLTVSKDNVAPQVSSVTTSVGKSIDVVFNEFVDALTATNLANYSVPGVTFSSATLAADGVTVNLVVVGSLAANFQITISNVKDYAGNTIAPNTLATGYTTGLAPGMISYWPLDAIQGTKTPDIVSGYDLSLDNMFATNLVPGKYANCFSFDNARKALLKRVHSPGDALPIYKYTDFTVSLWVKAPLQTDHRVFCESSSSANQPMFSIGTHNGGTDGGVDTYIRNDSNTTTGDHHHGALIAYDDTWHHICYVQMSNATPNAILYIDGVRDSVKPDPIWPLTINTTAIGAIQRAASAAWFTGLIDDVAVWSRALSTEEVSFLFAKGTPVPPPKPLPLTINSFTPDRPAVAQGDSITLRWDITKDATSVELQPGGDVTAYTAVGVGSFTVTPTYTTTYRLIVRRNNESVTNSTTVSVITGIASGWALLDNFDRYAVGGLPKPWGVSGAGVTVVDVVGNRMLSVGAGGDTLAGLPLGNLMLIEGQQRTLFCRFYLVETQAVNTITALMGLSDKGIRFYSDANGDLGPDVAFSNPDGNLQIGTRNGYGSALELSTFALQPQVPYNLWIDVQNDPIYMGDLFSVYVARDGDASRTVLWQGYRSDRNPYDTGILGPTGADLDNLTVGGNTANSKVYFDDFYLSKSGYNTAVPRVYGFTTPFTPAPITLTIRTVGTQVQISWASGTLLSATSLNGPWSPVTGATAPAYAFTPSNPAPVFYRAQQ